MRHLKKKSVLITGGAGFIGSHLCERFLGMGWDVLCIDNYFTGRKQNLEHLFGHPHFELIRHDIVEPFKAEVGLILNFACPASPPRYQADPIKTMKTAVIGTLNMLELAREVGAVFCQASSSEVYGDPTVTPQSEQYWGNVNPVGARSCYDEGKRAAETLCFDYHRTHGVDIRIIRIFNTYGPRMDPEDGRVVSNFIMQALRGEDLTIYGDGTQSRSFCYIDDLVEGIVQMVKQTSVIGPLNLGNDAEVNIKDLASIIINLTGSQSKLVTKDPSSDDPKQKRPNLGSAEWYLGYKNQVSLEIGLKDTIAYFKQEIARGSLGLKEDFS